MTNDLELIKTALRAYRSLPGGTVRQFPDLERRAYDPLDSASKVLTARLPGLREEYERCLKLVGEIDALLVKLHRAAALSDLAALDGETL